MTKQVAYCALLIFALIPSAIASAKERLLLTTHNLAPYGSFPKDSPIKAIADDSFNGYAVEAARCALENINWQFEIRVVPWKRAQKEVEIGKAHGFFAASQSDFRDSYATMTTTLADQQWTWYYKQDSSIPPNHPEFKADALVGSFAGANMQAWLESEGFNASFSAIDSATLLDALLVERIDAILANNYVMDKILKERSLRLGKQIQQDKPLGIYFRNSFLKKYPSFLPQLNAAIDICRSSD
ncbi:substrate-binding periplasmic protein [Thalassotalea euphylliae]|uniref:substrate-binding periplasmic protein n=1 Tax=Thalassotalea euphylliae TaxID=1655234 RepID=UPI003635E653